MIAESAQTYLWGHSCFLALETRLYTLYSLNSNKKGYANISQGHFDCDDRSDGISS